MKILITGATGFIGTKLLENLFLQGYDQINVLTRSTEKAKNIIPFPVDCYHWNPKTNEIDRHALEGVDVVIHLAGEGVADSRWTKKKKKRILQSRVKGTKLLIGEIEKMKDPPKKFISASAIGIFGDREEEELNNTSSSGKGFLSEVCQAWENTAIHHQIKEMKNIIIRIGIVLGTEGGALKKMLLPFKLGMGGKLGSGQQYMSWIHVADLIEIFIFLMKQENAEGIYHGVSPSPLRNIEFTKALGTVLKRPTFMTVPAFALKIIFGEMSQILLDGQKVIPRKLINLGFQYKFPNLELALKDLLQNYLNKEEKLITYQWVNKRPEDVFRFFSNKHNLEKITPAFLNFSVQSKGSDQLKEGSRINYKFTLRGIPLNWSAKIESFDKPQSFEDVQITGPYKKWRHTHKFIPIKSGTLIKDQVIYQLPFGLFGWILASPLVKNDLRKIFLFRFKKIKTLFA